MEKEEISIGRGVIQGGVLSPLLFLITFNDLLEELEENNELSFAYADDLAVVGETLEDLKKIIEIIEK